MEEATASTRSLEQIPTFLHVHVVRGRISEAEFAFFSSPLKDSQAARDGVPQLLYRPRPHPGRHGFLLEGKLLKWFRKKKPCVTEIVVRITTRQRVGKWWPNQAPLEPRAAVTRHDLVM